MPDHDGSGARIVCALDMDMVGSTHRGLRLLSNELYQFNKAFIEQIRPHLEALDLSSDLLKFTGDGWLLMVEGETQDKVASVVCLGLVMAHRFRSDLSRALTIRETQIPRLRIGICCGSDCRVKLPNGSWDWVGDSARKAVRAAECCHPPDADSTGPDEVIIDAVAYEHVRRDVLAQQIDLAGRVPAAKAERRSEYDFPAYVCTGLNTASALPLQRASYFIYALEAVGQPAAPAEQLAILQGAAETPPTEGRAAMWAETRKIILRAHDPVRADELLRTALAGGFTFDTAVWNHAIETAQDYAAAEDWHDQMLQNGGRPDVLTYNILMNRSRNYRIARLWLRRLEHARLGPLTSTYNTLLKLCRNQASIDGTLREMSERHVALDEITFNTIISKQRSYADALKWLETMEASGLVPNQITYHGMIKSAPDLETAQTWCLRMESAGYMADITSYNLVLRATKRYVDALRVMKEVRTARLEPDNYTFNTLLYRVRRYRIATGWYRRMVAEGRVPDTHTYMALVRLAPTFKSARHWVRKLDAAGCASNDYILGKMFAKASLAKEEPTSVLAWYLGLAYHPALPVGEAIANLVGQGEVEMALKYAEAYPHIDAAHAFFRTHEQVAVEFLRTECARPPRNPNALYALAVALDVVGKPEEAAPLFADALADATGPRRDQIRTWLLEHDTI